MCKQWISASGIGRIVLLFLYTNGKGRRIEKQNYKGIRLLDVLGKVLGRILIDKEYNYWQSLENDKFILDGGLRDISALQKCMKKYVCFLT